MAQRIPVTDAEMANTARLFLNAYHKVEGLRIRLGNPIDSKSEEALLRKELNQNEDSFRSIKESFVAMATQYVS
jgi:hypothetical protein